MNTNQLNKHSTIKVDIGNHALPLTVAPPATAVPPPPPPPTHQQIQNDQQHKLTIEQHASKILCTDPDIEDAFRRLTQNLKKLPDKFAGDLKQHQLMADGATGNPLKTAQSTGTPIHEAFVLSIEELDNASVSELIFPPKKPPQKHIYESPEARARRLARNAERMRERRANESDDEYRKRLRKMAEASRFRRQNENEIERAMRLVRDAARQRLRRALESPEKRADRLAKLAQRAREVRQNESPDQRADRLRKLAEHHRNRYARQRDQNRADVKHDIHHSSAINANNTFPAGPTSHQSSTQSVIKQENYIGNSPYSHVAHLRIPDFVQSPSSSSSNSSDLPPSQLNQTYPQLFRTNHFPDLPPHLTPARSSTDLIPPHWIPNQFPELSQNFSHTSLDAKYYQKIQQALTPSNLSPSVNNISYISNVATSANATIPLSSTAQFYRHQTPHQSAWPVPVSANSSSNSGSDTTFVRGRPIKILPSNDYRSINPELREEAERQQRMNDMLEAQINIMLTTPRQVRGRPNRGRETDNEREERLRKMAEARRMQRQKESPDERALRLKDLAERARKRREMIMATETESDRKQRLQRQAEYARQRRMKAQTPEALKLAEQKAKTLYTTLHQQKQSKENGKY